MERLNRDDVTLVGNDTGGGLEGEISATAKPAGCCWAVVRHALVRFRPAGDPHLPYFLGFVSLAM